MRLLRSWGIDKSGSHIPVLGPSAREIPETMVCRIFMSRWSFGTLCFQPVSVQLMIGDPAFLKGSKILHSLAGFAIAG